MDGSSELRQLAHLLRVGADTARDIAMLRTRDAAEIAQLVEQAEAIAERLDTMAAGGQADGASAR